MEEHKSEAEKAGATVHTRASRKLSQTTVNKSAITDHVLDKNHVISWDEARVVGKETDKYKRWVKEAMHIRKQGTTMNRDEGQFNLSHVYDDLLVEKTSSNTVTKQPELSAINTGSSLHHQC